VNAAEAERVRDLFALCACSSSMSEAVGEARARGWEGEAVDQPKRENARRTAVEPVHGAAVADERFVSWGD
jgi:hypothetical protein